MLLVGVLGYHHSLGAGGSRLGAVFCMGMSPASMPVWPAKPPPLAPWRSQPLNTYTPTALGKRPYTEP